MISDILSARLVYIYPDSIVVSDYTWLSVLHIASPSEWSTEITDIQSCTSDDDGDDDDAVYFYNAQ